MPGVKLIFHAIIQEKVVNGIKLRRPVIQNSAYYQQHLNKFFLGDKVVITIEKKRAHRSIEQNSFYWGAILPTISESTGHTEEDLHEFFKRKFLPPRYLEVLNEKIKIPGSTAKLNKPEFCEYLMKIEQLTGIPLPNPADAGYAPFPY